MVYVAVATMVLAVMVLVWVIVDAKLTKEKLRLIRDYLEYLERESR